MVVALLGGSHAQQDVLEQLFVDAALKAGSTADIRLALERVAGRRAIPPAGAKPPTGRQWGRYRRDGDGSHAMHQDTSIAKGRHWPADCKPIRSLWSS
jgi:hypothetical protein